MANGFFYDRPSYYRSDDDKNYGTGFTERQQNIIDGLPVNNLRNSEIGLIIKKAEKLGMDELAMDVYSAYEYRLAPPKSEYEYTIEECKEILQSFVPFVINWDD